MIEQGYPWQRWLAEYLDFQSALVALKYEINDLLSIEEERYLGSEIEKGED